MANEFGDFQTPLGLIQEVLDCLAAQHLGWTRVIEPTCGVGNFIQGIVQHPAFNSATEIHGIELQPQLIARANILSPDDRSVHIHQQNIFQTSLQALEWATEGNLLVIGNPPWVTNAQLGADNNTNLPSKINLKGLKGLDAITGSSNFDIAEAIILQIMHQLADQKPTIALLCKMSTARQVLEYAFQAQLPVADAKIWQVDAHRWFHVNVQACLLSIQLGSVCLLKNVPVYRSSKSTEIVDTLHFINQRLVRSEAVAMLHRVNGDSHLEWRQGLKHDAASVMELVYDNRGDLWNKLGEYVEIESEFVFPLLKSTDVFHQRVPREKGVIVTQRHLKEDTASIQLRAPQLWRYLSSHQNIFAQRKSSIYIGKSPFAIFGIGEYSFKPYKIAISGFHKEPRFLLVTPFNGKPVMFDDTCYFLSFDHLSDAAEVATLLNSAKTLDFLKLLMFPDAKRPITKKLLQNIDLYALKAIITQ